MVQHRKLTVLAAAVLCTSGAFAQESATEAKLRELSEKIERMRAESAQQIEQLRAQQKQLEAQQQQQQVVAKPAPEAAPEAVVKGDLPGSVKIPGTNTSVKIGGYARLDVVKDLGGGAFGSIAIPALVPFGGSTQSTRKGSFNMNARESRLYLKTFTPTSLGPVTTYFEGDFLGAGGNETVTNSSAFRLRHAYAELGPLLVGQTWTTFVDLASYGETLDFAGGNGVLQGIRAGQIRYTAKVDGHNQLAFSAENPESDIFGTTTTTMTAAVGPTSTTTLDKYPDLIAKYTYLDGWGRVTISGLARHLTFNNAGQAPVNGFVGGSGVTTGAWALQGAINTFGQDSVRYSVSGGSGVGRYVLGGAGNTAAVINGGKLDAIRQKAFELAYQHYWTPAVRSNLVYGKIIEDYPHPAVPLSTPSHIAMLWANVIWSPIPNGWVGVEWERATVKNDAVSTPTLSDYGKNDRLLMSFQYGF